MSTIKRPVGPIKSTAYYQARYVLQGESGFFRDSKSCAVSDPMPKGGGL